MRKLTAIFVASTLALGAANLAHAADTTSTTVATGDNVTMHHKGPRGPHHEMMFRNLNLTDAQRTQIRDIMQTERSKMGRHSQDDMRIMHNIIASDSFDRAKAEAEVNKMSEQHKTRMLAHMETQNKIYNILTADQKKQFNANFEKRLTDRQSHNGKMFHADRN